MARKRKKRPVHIPVARTEESKEPSQDSAQKKPDKLAEPEAPGRLSEEEFAQLVKKAQEYDELLDTLQRLKAEYVNFQKRTERERGEWREFCVRDVFTKVLPVVDNLERALEAAQQHGGKEELLCGVELVRKQFLQVLATEKIVPLESTGKKFDPRYHEAVMVEETDQEPPDTVISEMQRGYMVGDRVLRPAKVVVSRVPR